VSNNQKKAVALALSVSMLAMNTIPACAYSFNKKKNVIEAATSEYKFQDVNIDWWKNYDDEILEGYIVKAINENQDLRIATLKVEEARQNVKLQFSKELPNASVGASPAVYKMNGVTNTEGLFSVPIMVNYEADIFLKNHDKTKSAKKMYEVAKINERAAYLAVASSVGANYFNVIRLDKLIDIQNEIINDRKQIFELMKQRNIQGITSTADVTRAEKSYVMAVADMSDLKKARETLLNNLAVLTGESPNNANELKRISYSELIYKGKIPTEIPSDIIVKRPDYLAAEKMVEKAGIDVRVSRKEFLPTINIIGIASFMSTSLANSMNWTNAFSALAGSAMLPVFTGGAKFANLRLYKNKYEQIMQNYYKTNLVAIQEVNDSLSNLKLDDDKYHKNLKSYDMQKADYKYMQQRYQQGIMSKLDLLQQRETLLVMNKMVASSKTDCFIDQISLYKAVGGSSFATEK
jgi:NodT family efflux transporter outer membrane factor (OMF) lipoprotein